MLLRLQNAVASMGEVTVRQDRVANNLANVNTVGYRRDRTFAAALEERLDAEGAPVSTRVGGQWTERTAGALEQTGAPLDVALEGEGFFRVQSATGQARLTRAGQFVLAADGTVRTPAGDLTLLCDDGAPLTLPPSGGEILITTSGEVSVGGTPVGRIGVADVADARDLVRLDGATFDAAGVAVRPAEARVRQGFVEASNVNAVTEMADLIEHVRLFESQQKSLQTTDSVLGAVTRDLGAF